MMTANVAVANDIDNLNTIDDVQKFLVNKVNKEWKGITFIESNPADTSAFGKGKFFKIDLDNNGLTDLVINGTYFFAVTDNGDGKYESHIIDRGAFLIDKYTLVNIIYKDTTPLLLIKGYSEYTKRIDNKSITDTLIFKYGDFTEYNAFPDDLNIEEIHFSTTACYGTCPIFELSIMADQTATYNAIEYNEETGEFKTTIDTSSYNNLIRTINYIKLTTLEDGYSANWTDDQTVTLQIKYNNGQVKTITDYGAIGTFGLEHLYEQLFELRGTQKWK